MPTPLPEVEDLVVNWHVTEACNFRCRYCFAKWKHDLAEAELWRDPMRTLALLEGLHRFFTPSNRSNPLRAELRWRSVRLSLAGGEPTLLGDRLVDIAAQAKAIGFRVSLITNGSRPEVIASVAQHLDMIGISIDSADRETNAAVGRTDSKGAQVSAKDAMAIVARVRDARPDAVVKINTVVNAANADEDMSSLVAGLGPDRWKVMRMLPVLTDVGSVAAESFRAFAERHCAFQDRMTVEDNPNMERSYIMVDPRGRFFQNGSGTQGYRYSRPIPEEGVDAAFLDVGFRPDSFAVRYPQVLAGRAAR